MIIGRIFRPVLKLAVKWIIEDINKRRIKETSIINVGGSRKIG
jgi:hypothetical protein